MTMILSVGLSVGLWVTQQLAAQPAPTPELVIVPADPPQPPTPVVADVAGPAAEPVAAEPAVEPTTPAVPPAPTVVAPVETPPALAALWRRASAAGPQIEGPRDGRADCRATAAVCFSNHDFAFWPRVRLRTGYQFVQTDAGVASVGRNDGFFLDQARVGFDAAYRDDLRFRAIIELNSFLPNGATNQAVTNVLAAARDVWVSYLPSDWLSITAGQQFMPSDMEGSTTLAALPFIGRSVMSYATPGLSPSRQIGLVVQGTEGARFDSVSLEYAVGVGNGNGQNIAGNDNKLPAAYARVGAGYEGLVRVAIGGRYNPRTAGSAPDLFNETDALGFADVNANIEGIEVAAVGQLKQTTFGTLVPDPQNPLGAELAWGATAWVALRDPLGVSFAGAVPAYRFSVYDPSDRFPDDQVIENTLAVMWTAPFDALSLSVLAEVALLTEFGPATRDLDNFRAGALVQLDL
jgi:hypothetical protein